MKGNRRIRNQRNSRNERGTGFAELALGMMATIALTLFAVDIGTAILCYGINDRACRDAARAAAEVTNQTQAQRLANRIVKTYASASGVGSTLISAPEVVSVRYVDFNGNPPDGVSPFVTVVTRSTARPVTPINIFGKPMAGGTFPVAKSYTFPIVKLTVNAPPVAP